MQTTMLQTTRAKRYSAFDTRNFKPLNSTSSSAYTNRCSSQNWTGSRQYGQVFILAVQRSHAS
jgi:hypothetical protein